MAIKTKVLRWVGTVSVWLSGACGIAPTADPSQETLAATASDLTKAAPIATGGGVLLIPPKSRYCTDELVAYVVYPMTVCTPPIIGGTATTLARVAASAAAAVSSGASLSAQDSGFAAASTLSPFCHVNGGPWFADVKTTESCILGVPDRSVLAIIAAPQPFSTSWDGDISAVPPPFNPNVFALKGTVCDCCPGFISCLDGRCLPPGVSCDNNGPPP